MFPINEQPIELPDGKYIDIFANGDYSVFESNPLDTGAEPIPFNRGRGPAHYRAIVALHLRHYRERHSEVHLQSSRQLRRDEGLIQRGTEQRLVERNVSIDLPDNRSSAGQRITARISPGLVSVPVSTSGGVANGKMKVYLELTGEADISASTLENRIQGNVREVSPTRRTPNQEFLPALLPVFSTIEENSDLNIPLEITSTVERVFISFSEDFFYGLSDLLKNSLFANNNQNFREILLDSFSTIYGARLNVQNFEARIGLPEPSITLIPPAINLYIATVRLRVINLTGKIPGYPNLEWSFSGFIQVSLGIKWGGWFWLFNKIAVRFGYGSIEKSQVLRTVLGRILSRGVLLASAIVTGTIIGTAVVVGFFAWVVNHAREEGRRRALAVAWADGFTRRLFYPNPQNRPQDWLGNRSRRPIDIYNATIRGVDDAIVKLHVFRLSEREMIEQLVISLQTMTDYRISSRDRRQVSFHLGEHLFRAGGAPSLQN